MYNNRILFLGCVTFTLLIVIALHTRTDTHDQQRLENLLQRTTAVLETAGAVYWVSGGTLLGAHLRSRVILGDFDADIDVEIASLDAIRGAPWSQSGLFCYEGYGGFRVKAQRWDTLRVDIFVRRSVDDILVYAWPRLDAAYPNTLMPLDWVYPLRRYPIRTFEVYGPAHPHKILQNQYGNYTIKDIKTWSEHAWVYFERQVWARIIPAASYFSPMMPY